MAEIYDSAFLEAGQSLSGNKQAVINNAEASDTGIGDDFATFLTLLTTQLEHQDPTEPMDTSEFTNQIALFSQVEQTAKVNDSVGGVNDSIKELQDLNVALQDAFGTSSEEAIGKLEQLLAQSQLSNPAVFYMGRDVEAVGNLVQLKEGEGEVRFITAGPADKIAVEIQDETGAVVREAIVSGNYSGQASWTWDGKDSSGKPVDNGVYSFAVRATLDGEEVEVDERTGGIVTGAQFTSDDAILQIGDDIFVPLSQITAIKEAPKEAAPSSGSQVI